MTTISPPTERSPDLSGVLARCYGYARDATAGRIVVGEKVRLACRRFLDELEKQNNPDYPWRFDEALAARPVGFMERFLVPTKGDYDRLELMPWQCFVECNLYGWVDKRTGLRRFREALILVGTGNGKSTLMAGNATFGACKDGERGADIYLLANSKDQAGIVFNECLGQIRASKPLAKRFRTLRDGVYYDAMSASIRHRASDSKRLDGLNPHMAIFDEIHEFRDYKLINIIKRKNVKRRQPLILYITTMGYVTDGPLSDYYGLFSDVLIPGKIKPEVADRLFSYIAELDARDDIEDTSCWVKANPGLGVVLHMRDLLDSWERAKKVPRERADFICKQLNIMVQADDMAFISPDVMPRNLATIPEENLLGRRCFGGFDLSSREDFTAAALEFPLDDGRFYVLLHSWVPRRKVEMDQEKIDYYGMAMRGLLTIVEGEYISQDDVYQWFCAQAEKYEITSIGYDPANAVKLRQMLEMKGFNCQIVRQGPLTLNDPMKDVKELLLGGRIVSNGDPMLRWYTENVRISAQRQHTDKANWMPTKNNRYRKIDGFMAWLDAHCIQMQQNPGGVPAAPPAVYSIRLDSSRARGRRMRGGY